MVEDVPGSQVIQRLTREDQELTFGWAAVGTSTILDHGLTASPSSTSVPGGQTPRGILQLEYISFILHLLGSHLQSGPEVGGN